MHRQFQRIRTFHFWASQNRCSSCYHNYCWGHCLGGCCFDLLLLQLLLKPLKVAPPPKRLLPSAATTIATANAEASAPTVATSTSVAAVTAASNTTANTASAGTDYCCSECCCTLFHPLGTVSTAAASSFLLPQPQLQLLLLLRPSFAVAATIAATATKYWQLWMLICLHPLLVFFCPLCHQWEKLQMEYTHLPGAVRKSRAALFMYFFSIFQLCACVTHADLQ